MHRQPHASSNALCILLWRVSPMRPQSRATFQSHAAIRLHRTAHSPRERKSAGESEFLIDEGEIKFCIVSNDQLTAFSKRPNLISVFLKWLLFRKHCIEIAMNARRFQIAALLVPEAFVYLKVSSMHPQRAIQRSVVRFRLAAFRSQSRSPLSIPP